MTIRRGAFILLEVLGAVVAVAVVASLVVFWRLTQGPVSVDFLTPYIERSFAGESIEVEVGSTALIWNGAEREVDLEARDWRLRDRDGGRLAYLPRVSLSLSLPALARGIVAPTHIEIDRARLRVLRHADGRFAFSGESEAPGEIPDLSAVADDVLRELVQVRQPERPLSYLQQIEIHEARIVFDDRRLDRRLELRQASLNLWRGVGGIGGRLDGVVVAGERAATIGSALWYKAEEQELETRLDVADLDLAAFGGWVGFEIPAGLQMKLAGTVDASVPVDGRLPVASFSLTGREGEVDMPAVFSVPFEIAALDLEGRIDGPEQSLRLSSLSMQLGGVEEDGPVLSATADVVRSTEGLELDLEALVADVEIQDLRDYWPIVLRDGARPWIATNIMAGGAPQASVRVRATLPLEPGAKPILHEVDGDFTFEDLEIHYLRPLPPAEGVHGRATFDAGTFQFTVEGGHMQDLDLEGGEVVIYGLEGEDHRIAMDFGAAGPLPTVLALLEHPRLNLLGDLGFTAEGSAGATRAQLRFAFPLVGALTFDEVDVGVEGQVQGLRLRRAVMDRDLTGGPLDLTLDQDGMRVEGNLELAGVPVQDVVWYESFTGRGDRTRVSARVPRLDGDGRAALGLETGKELTGPLAVNLDLVAQGRGGSTRIDLDVDLAQAELQLAELGWSKPPGQPGSVATQLLLVNDRPRELNNLSVTAEGLTLQEGSARFDGEGAPEAFFFGRASLARSELHGLSLRLLPDGGLEAEIGGGRLDVEPFLAEEGTEPDTAPATAAGGEAPPRTLRIIAPALAELRFGEGRYLEAVELRLHRTAEGWHEAVLRGAIPRSLWYVHGRGGDTPDSRPRRLSLVYGPSAERAGYAVNLESDDLGAALRAIDLFDMLEGGELRVVGRGPGRLPDSPMTFELWAEDYVLIDAPVMARLLTVASLSGLGNVLAGEGIAFRRLIGEVEYADDRLTTELLRAYGPSLGITARGHLELEGEGSDLRGTLVPAYSVNQVLGAIPILGFILTGREGEGVLGVTYRLSGSLDEPRFSVNPLSVLAPGFLRGIFDLPAGDGESSPPSAFPDGFDDTLIGN